MHRHGRGFTVLLTLTLVSCTAPPALNSRTEQTVFRGELATYIADYPDGHSETQHYLALPDGSERLLQLAEAPLAQPGDTIEVGGRELGETIVVDALRTVSRPPRTVELASGAAKPPKK